MQANRSNGHLNLKSLAIPLRFPGPALAATGSEADAMFHPDTQFLIDRWTVLARAPGVRAGVPARAAFAPETLAARLPRAFLVERVGEDPVLRLAGSWIEAFHDQPLKNRSLLDLWRAASRPLVSAALAQTLREARPVVVAALAGSISAPMEVALAPLRGASGRPDMVLGLYAPGPTLALAVNEPRLLTARVSIGVGDPGRAALALAAVGGRRIA